MTTKAGLEKKSQLKKNNALKGNPASDFCQRSEGFSEIFTDNGNNQHDYCRFKEGYVIDSWNFMMKFNK